MLCVFGRLPYLAIMHSCVHGVCDGESSGEEREREGYCTVCVRACVCVCVCVCARARVCTYNIYISVTVRACVCVYK